MLRFFTEICEFVFLFGSFYMYIKMMSSFKCQQWQCQSSVRSSASFEEASQYGLGRLGFSDLSLKNEQRLSIRAIYKSKKCIHVATGFGKACVIKSSLL